MFEQDSGRSESKGADHEADEAKGVHDGQGSHDDIVWSDLERPWQTRRQPRAVRRGGASRPWARRRGSGVDGEKSDIVTTGRHGVESDRLGEGHPVKLRIVAAGAVEADDLIEEAALLGALGQIVHDPGVAKSESDTGLVDNICQLPGTQSLQPRAPLRPARRDAAVGHGRRDRAVATEPCDRTVPSRRAGSSTGWRGVGGPWTRGLRGLRAGSS